MVTKRWSIVDELERVINAHHDEESKQCFLVLLTMFREELAAGLVEETDVLRWFDSMLASMDEVLQLMGGQLVPEHTQPTAPTPPPPRTTPTQPTQTPPPAPTTPSTPPAPKKL